MQHEETLSRVSAKSVDPYDFSGRWTNELASSMDLVQEKSVLTGVYSSAVSGEEHPTIGALSGYAHGDLISFTVKWENLAITSWVGRRRTENGDDVIDTLWQMTTMGDDGAEGFWHSIYAGADRFTRGSAPVNSAKDEALEATETVKA